MAGHGSSAALRFGRMLPADLPLGDPGPAARERLAAAMMIGAEGATTAVDGDEIPAGYTYFAQFVDHDLTFDATPTFPAQGKGPAPGKLANLRTPRLDLDSLYGAGPDDQPYLYDQQSIPRGIKLLITRRKDGVTDVPRNQQNVALLGDPRNDDHQIISQLHLLFIRFHNRVVDHVVATSPAGTGRRVVFERARQIVRHHYQRIVLTDFLPRIVPADVLKAVRKTGRPALPGDGAMPVEFSAAAYRFGHSMVRETYRLNAAQPQVPVFDGTDRDLHGGRPLPAGHVIEWTAFFRGRPSKEQEIQPAMRIDHRIAQVMRHVKGPKGASIAELNLHRGAKNGLPDGRAAAKALKVDPLSDDLLLEPVREALAKEDLAPLRKHIPLWFYVLREAAVEEAGQRLGPVGGRIVAGTLLGVLARDDEAIDPADKGWRSELWPEATQWTMFLLQAYASGLDWAAVKGKL